MNPEKSQWGGHLAALAVYIIFGINPNCSKAVVPEYIAPEVYTAVRMLFGCLGFWGLSLFAKCEKVPWKDQKVMIGGGVIMAGTAWNSIGLVSGDSRGIAIGIQMILPYRNIHFIIVTGLYLLEMARVRRR